MTVGAEVIAGTPVGTGIAGDDAGVAKGVAVLPAFSPGLDVIAGVTPGDDNAGLEGVAVGNAVGAVVATGVAA